MLGGEGILDVTLGFVLGMIVVLLVSCLGAALATVIAIQVQRTLGHSLVQMCLICGVSGYAGVFAIMVLSLIFVRGAFPPIVAVEFGLGRVLLLSVVTSISAGAIVPGVVWIDRRYLEVHEQSSEAGR